MVQQKGEIVRKGCWLSYPKTDPHSPCTGTEESPSLLPAWLIHRCQGSGMCGGNSPICISTDAFIPVITAKYMVSLSIAVLGGRQFVSLGEKDKYFEFCMLEEEQLESMWRRKLEVV